MYVLFHQVCRGQLVSCAATCCAVVKNRRVTHVELVLTSQQECLFFTTGSSEIIKFLEQFLPTIADLHKNGMIQSLNVYI